MGEFAHGVVLARRLGDTWAMYANEFMASVDARSHEVGPVLSDRCGWFTDVRIFLATLVKADDTNIPGAAMQSVLDIPGHIRDVHPEYWHLFFDDPGPAANALQDQLNAVRREATERFGPKPDPNQ